jgi:hypothetical protein
MSRDRNAGGALVGRQIDLLGHQVVDIPRLRGPSPFLDRVK